MKPILVPTDFSVHARNAMKYAIKLADTLHADLIFFHCTNVPVTLKFVELSQSEMNNVMRNDVREKMLMLNDEINRTYNALRVKRELARTETIVKSGMLIAEEVLAIAKKKKVDLIVTGTHGASGTEKIFGSNTSNLISKSNIPVMAIPRKYRYKAINKVIYASDLRNTVTELKMIIPIAQTFSANIDIFNLYYEETAGPEKFFSSLVTQVNYPNLRLIQLKRNLDKTFLQQLREYLDHHKPDLLVMFPSERNILEKIFYGSNTERLSYNLRMPLLSIKKK